MAQQPSEREEDEEDGSFIRQACFEETQESGPASYSQPTVMEGWLPKESDLPFSFFLLQ